MIGVLATGAAQQGTGGFISMMLIWVVAIGGMMYFMTYRPQKKERKRMAELFGSLELGDSVLTTSGF